MKRSLLNSVLAAATALALVACGGGAANNPIANPYPTTNAAPSSSGSKVLARIVGIGDSLTAGEESDGLVGVTAANPLYPGTSPQPAIPASQPFGFWADLYNAVNGAGSANAVLPLMQSPGLGTFLLLTNSGGFTSTQTSCSGLNALAFSSATASQTRVSPSVQPLDLGVPGQLVHEALYQTGPQGPCQDVAVAPGSVFQAETTDFLPILGGFGGKTQVQAARSLSPTLTTVWLGANDVLKYALSGGAFGPTPASSVQSDLMTIVQTMQQGGSQVAIGNLPDVLLTPLFVSIPNVPVQATDPLTVLIQTLSSGAIPAGTALTIANAVVAANSLTAGSYITFSAMSSILAVATGGAVPSNLVSSDEALTATFAAQVQTQNTAYNTAIAAVASATGAALVDIHALFVQAAQSGVAVNPPHCCTLTPFGGLTSFDQLHPSYTGYAIIANAWISAINAKFGTTIPAVSVTAAYDADPYAPYSPSYGLGLKRK
ncbi:MAG TPA: SGNH/GDSL hydrolase family protein [Candidatus Acidoferrales bacterium]|nr:SGNH/GDSL hydrolase family protein [Candidatus Acidoferrales bacterium]